jgi:hypothetical protein
VLPGGSIFSCEIERTLNRIFFGGRGGGSNCLGDHLLGVKRGGGGFRVLACADMLARTPLGMRQYSIDLVFMLKTMTKSARKWIDILPFFKILFIFYHNFGI